jgi:hypothetical protein
MFGGKPHCGFITRVVFCVANLLNSDFPYRESVEQGLSQSVQYFTNTEISFIGNNQDVDTVYIFVTSYACSLSLMKNII